MKRWVPAPSSENHTANSVGVVLGVSLDEGERVEWVYTVLPDGRRIVTGYNILPILTRAPKKEPKLRKNRGRGQQRTGGRTV